MFRKVLSISAVMLLLASYSAHAMKVECGTMTPEDCKKELGMQMDKMTMMKMTEMVKMEMMKIKKMWTEIMDDMPTDSMHVKTIMTAMEKMKMQMAMMDKMTMMKMMEMTKMDMMKMMDMMTKMKGDMPADNMNAKMMMETMEKMKMDMTMMEKMMDGVMDMETMKTTIRDAFMWMQPDFKTAQMEDKTNMEKFNEVMEKHGMPEEKIAEDFMMMMNEMGKMWMEMMSGLREEDMKTYPQYMEMKTMMKTMMETTEEDKKMEMMMLTMRMMMEFNETPYMKAMMMAMGMKKNA